MEPWDGPALIAFTDGHSIGAILDRNGLRPARYIVTKAGLVIMSSEVGVLEVPPAEVERKGRLRPGRMFLIDFDEGRIVDDDEIKGRLAAQRPYAQWVETQRGELSMLPEKVAAKPFRPSKDEVIEQQQLFGYTDEELRMLIGPMASKGEEAVGSMGTDTPLAVLSNKAQPLTSYFKQLFAQVTNPPIDCIREELITATAKPCWVSHVAACCCAVLLSILKAPPKIQTTTGSAWPIFSGR